MAWKQPTARAAGLLLHCLVLPYLPATVCSASRYQVEFGQPKLVGSSNLTHFWFPVNLIELSAPGMGDGALVQGIQQVGDGEKCPPKAHPDWPCSTLRVSSDHGSSWRPELMNSTSQLKSPPTDPFPLLPETPSNGRRAKDRSNFSSIHALKCVNASCSGEIVKWSAIGPQGLSVEGSQPLTVHGVPSDVRIALDPGNPLMLQDGSILVSLYVSFARSCFPASR